MNEEPMIRNAERTRQAILQAALETIQERGTNAALGAIAERAGVTKGGLLHHFPSRDALLHALAKDSLDQLRIRVQELVELSENHPGKLLRGYIRALFEQNPNTSAHFDYPGIWSTLSVVPGVPEMLREDGAHWRARFAEDGLHPDRILFAQHAADGVAASMQWDDGLTPSAVEHARAVIIALTDDNGPVG